MALMRCPECNHEMSDTAVACTNCGYIRKNIEPFKKKVTVLSKKNYDKKKALLFLIPGTILTTFSLFTLTIGIGFITLIVGVFLMVKSFIAFDNKTQVGDCPYCNTELRVKVGNSSFKCPVCNNIGNQTESTLESTH